MKAERMFERVLWRARLFVLIPVIFTLIAAIVASIQGAVAVIGGVRLALTGDQHESTLGYLMALDTFLLATILYVASIGLYELFVAKLEDVETGAPRGLPSWLAIQTLDDLKAKLASVVTIVIAITYLSELTRWAEGESRILSSPIDILWLSIGVAVAMVSLILFSREIGGHAERSASATSEVPSE